MRSISERQRRKRCDRARSPDQRIVVEGARGKSIAVPTAGVVDL